MPQSFIPHIVKKLLVLLSVFSIGAFILYSYVFGTVVKPYEIGVRKNAFNFLGVLQKGYANQGLAPGWHWQVPGLSEIIILPRTFQFVQLNDGSVDSRTGSDQGTAGDFKERSLVVPTGDGARVKTDITAISRISSTPVQIDSNNLEQFNEYAAKQEGLPPFAAQYKVSTGGPGDLINYAGELQSGQLGLFSQTLKGELREELSALTSTEFYNPILRERATLRASEKVRKQESSKGIEIWATLLRRYLYEEEKIDNQIFAKNLQEQTEQLNSAKKELAAAEAKTEEARALWDAKIRNLGIEGQTNAEILLSEGALYKEEKVAEGDLLIKTAKADIDKKRSNLYANIEGADVYLAREMAPILGTLGGGIVNNIDPYNLSEWITKLTGGKGSDEE